MRSFIPAQLTGPRAKRIIATSFGFVLVRGGVVLTGIITTPPALRLLHKEQYGLWMALTGLIMMLSFADLGLGGGLTNAMATEEVLGPDRVRKAFSNTLISVCVISFGWFAIGSLLIPILPWASMFGLKSPAAIAVAQPTVWVLMVCTLLNIPFSLVNRVQLGRQEGMLNSFWAIGQGVGQLVCCYTAIYLRCSLPVIILGFFAPITIGNAVNLFWELAFRSKSLRPRWSDFDLQLALSFVRIGGSFLLLQGCASLTQWSDYVIVGHIDGAAANAVYAVAFRIFSVALLATYMTRALWPAFAEAIAKSQREWASQLFWKVMRFNFAYGISAGILLPLISPWLVRHWVHDIVVPREMLVAFGFWLFVLNFVEGLTALSMADLFRKPHTILFTTASLVTVVVRIFLVRAMGPTGVIWGVVSCYTFIYLVPMFIVMRKGIGSMVLSVPVAETEFA